MFAVWEEVQGTVPDKLEEQSLSGGPGTLPLEELEDVRGEGSVEVYAETAASATWSQINRIRRVPGFMLLLVTQSHTGQYFVLLRLSSKT